MPTNFLYSVFGQSGYSGASGYSGISGFPPPLSVGAAVSPVVDPELTNSVTVNWISSNNHAITLNANLTALNFVNAASGQSVNLYITNPSTYTIQWSSTSLSAVVWSTPSPYGNVAPIQSTAISAYTYGTSAQGFSTFFNGSQALYPIATTNANVLGNYMQNGSTAPATTFEAWVYPTGYTTSGGNAWQFSSIFGKGNLYINFGLYNGYVRLYHYNQSGGTVYQQSVAQVSLSAWSHIAITINGSTLAMYINGVPDAATGGNESPTAFSNFNTAGQNGQIWFGYEMSGGNYFQGYISNFRLSNAVVYSGAFTPSRTPLSATSSTQCLMFRDPVLFRDSTKNVNNIIANGIAAYPTVSYLNPFSVRTLTAYPVTDVYTFTYINGVYYGSVVQGYTPTTATFNVSALIVGSGGGAGGDMGGGGGGGGVIFTNTLALTAGTFTYVQVGSGGMPFPAASTFGQPGAHQYTISASNGQNTIFGSLTALGGGYGGSSYQSYTPNNGAGGGANGVTGTGGGSSAYSNGATNTGGAGTPGQGYRGGNCTGQYYGGGGGGAGGPGYDASNRPDGGIGFLCPILGYPLYWGGGGGGAAYSGGSGGYGAPGGGGGGAVNTSYGGPGYNNAQGGGGGGNNAQTNHPGGNAGANTGGGGGAGSHYNANNRGGQGGSGIVIISYPGTPRSSSGDIITTVNGYATTHLFLSSGAFVC